MIQRCQRKDGKIMFPVLTILPAIKRVELRCIGGWENLGIELSPTMNIITGESGAGKTTILEAIKSSLNPSPERRELLGRHSDGRVIVELSNPTIELNTDMLEKIPDRNRDPQVSHGDWSLSLLRIFLSEVPRGFVVMFDDDVLGVLDDNKHGEAIRLMKKAKCQIIGVSGRRSAQSNFEGAKIFYCMRGPKDGSSGFSCQVL